MGRGGEEMRRYEKGGEKRSGSGVERERDGEERDGEEMG